MAQIKIFGIKDKLNPIKKELSDVIHSCIVEALQYPQEKRSHRFIGLEKEDFIYPEDRSEAYTIIEVRIMEGRTIEARKKLVRLLFDRIEEGLSISQQDIEIQIIESPASNWGFRGKHGDEIQLDYKIEV